VNPPRLRSAKLGLYRDLDHSVFWPQSEQVLVAGVEHLRCASCGEVTLRYESARALQEHGVEVYRLRHDLLTAEEICALRQQLGLTQAQLAALL